MFPCSPEHPRKELYSLTAAWQHACFLGHKVRQAKHFPKGRFHVQNTSHVLPASGRWMLQPPCWTMLCLDCSSIPRQWSQGSSQLKGISLSAQSLQLLSPQNLSQLLDVPSAGDSMSLIHLHPLPERELKCHSLLFSRAGTWAVTPYGVYVWHPISAS